MARALLLEHGGFRIGERVELTQQGEQQVAGLRSKTGTVVGSAITLRCMYSWMVIRWLPVFRQRCGMSSKTTRNRTAKKNIASRNRLGPLQLRT